MSNTTTLFEDTAWNLIGFPDIYRDGGPVNLQDARVRIKGGRAVYDDVIYHDDTPGDRVKLGRLDVGREGLHVVLRYIDPDTILEVVQEAR